MKICPICQEIIANGDLKKTVAFTPGKMIRGVFYGNESHYYHKDCIQNEKLLLCP